MNFLIKNFYVLHLFVYRLIQIRFRMQKVEYKLIFEWIYVFAIILIESVKINYGSSLHILYNSYSSLPIMDLIRHGNTITSMWSATNLILTENVL